MRMRKMSDNSDFNDKYFELRVYKPKKGATSANDNSNAASESETCQLMNSVANGFNNKDGDITSFACNNKSIPQYVDDSMHEECQQHERKDNFMLHVNNQNSTSLPHEANTKLMNDGMIGNNNLYELTQQFIWLMNNDRSHKLPLKPIDVYEIQREWNEIVNQCDKRQTNSRYNNTY
ncbi:hypothetical protein ABK040_015562 [Willaertia magna]